MKHICLICALFMLVALPACAQTLRDTLSIETQDGQSHSFQVELALSPEDIQRGLMHRTSLGENAGMLFYFGGREEERFFWMKNTLIPLDMLFIKADGTIHHIHENAKPNDLTSVPSKGPVAAVLEIRGGRSAELGLKPGDIVKYSFFRQ